jgi:TetR/AcrR family transcriptional regulator, regulator of autoinduction and epiphytic fitness
MAGGSPAPAVDPDEGCLVVEEPGDGRLARGVHTRMTIVQAAVTLIDSGDNHPATSDVATRAGVSLRTVFRHFGDVEGLFCEVAYRQASRYQDLIPLLPPNGPVATRILATCRQRRQLFEVIGPVLRVAQDKTEGSPRFNQALAQHRARLLGQLTRTLGPEIDAHGSEVEVRLETLTVATGWRQWNMLRLDIGHSASSAERLLAFTVTCILH